MPYFHIEGNEIRTWKAPAGAINYRYKKADAMPNFKNLIMGLRLNENQGKFCVVHTAH